MILEYLAHCGFDRAVNELKQQLRERRMGKQQAWRPVGRDVQSNLKERMLKALDRGDRGEVFKLWENFVPPLVRRSDREAQKLEFYLNVFFAIFPLHPSNASPDPAGLSASMALFKAFLEADGSYLASTPEFLAYYALPYVPEISAHPSFSELFTQVPAVRLAWPLRGCILHLHPALTTQEGPDACPGTWLPTVSPTLPFLYNARPRPRPRPRRRLPRGGWRRQLARSRGCASLSYRRAQRSRRAQADMRTQRKATGGTA